MNGRSALIAIPFGLVLFIVVYSYYPIFGKPKPDEPSTTTLPVVTHAAEVSPLDVPTLSTAQFAEARLAMLGVRRGNSQGETESLTALGPAVATILAHFLSLPPGERDKWCTEVSQELLNASWTVQPNAAQYDWKLDVVLQEIMTKHAAYRAWVLHRGEMGVLFEKAVHAASEPQESGLILDALELASPATIPIGVVEGRTFTDYFHDARILPVLIRMLTCGDSDRARAAARRLIELTGRDAEGILRIETPELSSRTHIHALSDDYLSDPATRAAQWRDWLRTARPTLKWNPDAPNPAGRCTSPIGDCVREPGKWE